MGKITLLVDFDSSKNLNQVNLLAEFKRWNNPIQNENFNHTCQNISNELMFDRMILKTFHINTSNYWKLSKIWVMSKLKNPTLNSIIVWVHHSKIITLNLLRGEVSFLSIFLAWLAWANNEFSQLICRELSFQSPAD